MEKITKSKLLKDKRELEELIIKYSQKYKKVLLESNNLQDEFIELSALYR